MNFNTVKLKEKKFINLVKSWKENKMQAKVAAYLLVRQIFFCYIEFEKLIIVKITRDKN